MIYPNIVPENNLRLPDALTIKHGPAPLLAKFVLEGDKLARRRGIRLRLRHDFGELLYLNKTQVAGGTWFRLVDHLNPEYCDLTPEDSYWISGEDEHGEIVLTQAGRIYYWPDTTLEQEALRFFYADREENRKCIVTAQDAKRISGVVFLGGARWSRPDYRAIPSSRLISRLGRAYALARWPVDWTFALMSPLLVSKGLPRAYGYFHTSPSIFFPASPWGDLEVVVASVPTSEAYADLADFLATELSGERGLGSRLPGSIISEHIVTNTSPEGVFHGRSSLS